MKTQDFIINLQFVPENDKKKYFSEKYETVIIKIPKEHCGKKLIISKTLHPTHGSNMFDDYCLHFGNYQWVYLNSIKTLRCDCGGDKCNTTHSIWCSTNNIGNI